MNHKEMISYEACPCCGKTDIIKVFSAKDYTVSGEEFEICECRNCTVRFTQNIPDAEQIGKYYQSEDYVSHSDTNEGLINKLYHKVRRRTLLQKKKLVENLTGKNNVSILDVGCGTGAFLNVMRNNNWNVTGLEPDETARQKAKELYGLNLETSEIFFDLLPASFDAITMWHVLEHVYDLHGYINQLNKLLTPTGKLFIAVPNYTCYDEKVYKEFWAAYDVPRHLYHFSPASMKKLLSKHDLKIDLIKPMWYDSFYVSMLSEKYKTGKSHPLKAFVTGGISNTKALINKEKCSSLIYVASKAPSQPFPEVEGQYFG